MSYATLLVVRPQDSRPEQGLALVEMVLTRSPSEVCSLEDEQAIYPICERFTVEPPQSETLRVGGQQRTFLRPGLLLPLGTPEEALSVRKAESSL